MAKQESKVAIVTGSNKGIGLEIVKQLASKGIATVLTARDENRGAAAVKLLQSQGLDVQFHQLDVSSPSSISTMVDWLQQKFGTVDILVNNAGIMSNSLINKMEEANALLDTNYYGSKRVTEAAIPLLKPGSRIINISSRLGQFDNGICPLKNEFQHKHFADVENLSEQVIELCLKEFREAVSRGKLPEEGYPESVPDYCISKFALNAYTRVLAKRLETNKIFVNSMCPGYTKTDMTEGKGNYTVEEGADTAVWLATMEDSDYPSGKFFAERKEIHF